MQHFITSNSCPSNGCLSLSSSVPPLTPFFFTPFHFTTIIPLLIGQINSFFLSKTSISSWNTNLFNFLIMSHLLYENLPLSKVKNSNNLPSQLCGPFVAYYAKCFACTIWLLLSNSSRVQLPSSPRYRWDTLLVKLSHLLKVTKLGRTQPSVLWF